MKKNQNREVNAKKKPITQGNTTQRKKKRRNLGGHIFLPRSIVKNLTHIFARKKKLFLWKDVNFFVYLWHIKINVELNH